MEVLSQQIRKTQSLYFYLKNGNDFKIFKTTWTDVQWKLFISSNKFLFIIYHWKIILCHVSKHSLAVHQYYLAHLLRDSEYYALRDCACKVRLVLNQIESLDRSWLFWACWSGLDWCKLIDSKLDCTNDLTNPD